MSKSRKYRIFSETESKIMEVIWIKNEPVTALQIFNELDMTGQPTMIYQGVNALKERGILEIVGVSEEQNYARLFGAIVKPEDYAYDVATRYFESDLIFMRSIILHYIKENKNDAEKISELKTLFENMDIDE